MPHTLFTGQHHIHLDKVDSTNNYAKELLRSEKPPEGTIVTASAQLEGRGQTGNTWKTEAGKNLTLSLILYPSYLESSNQFFLNMAVALGVKDCCEHFLADEIHIKWPNDIYYGNRKLGGILIENTLSGAQITSTVAGIGLNVNQEQFDPELPNPVSMKQILKQEISLDKLTDKLCEAIEKYYLQLRQRHFNFLDKAYTVALFRYQKTCDFRKGSQILRGEINGVTKEGKLIIHSSGKEYRFGFQEVAMVI